MSMALTGCRQVCPYNTLSGCIKDEANGGVCILSNIAQDCFDDENVVCHCNLKENADLIAKTLDADCNGEVFELKKSGRWLHKHFDYCTLTCSECDTVWQQILFSSKPNYCPNCGATMDREENQDE